MLNSSDGFFRFLLMPWEVKSRPRFSHRRPSVAVCLFSFNSLRTRSWRLSDLRGAASWRSRIFYAGHPCQIVRVFEELKDMLALIFPVMSLFTGLKAAEPSTSRNVLASQFQKYECEQLAPQGFCQSWTAFS